jgi:hypothetical protein
MTQPIVRSDSLDHTPLVVPPIEDAAQLWSDVHERVQRHLAVLEAEVRRRVADVQVDKGRTHGKQFYLFSYKTFSVPGSGRDPLVSGISFTPSLEGVTIEADVSGEENGDLVFAEPGRTVSSRREDVLAAVDEAGRKLCQSVEAITAVFQAGPPS